MATAAFKSTSKRGNQNPTPTTSSWNSRNSNRNLAARKRSQSVSAISRVKHPTVDTTTPEFYHKRENPLFLNSASPTGENENEIGKITEKEKRAGESILKTASTTTAAERGRSSTRNSGVKNGIGRSLSRVRGRSVSRGSAYESEKEQEMTLLTNIEYHGDIKRVPNNSKNGNKFRNCADVQRWKKSPEKTGASCQATECSEDDSVCSFQFSNWGDGASTCSLSEAEDRTNKAVYKQMRAIRWSNGVAFTDVADVTPDLVNSRPVAMDLDIRREYARKLEESEERARKLRADLAVEEHRGQEFSRMLKATHPDPQTCTPQKSRMGRKSTERKRISNRLTEEAMAYFDECVSISTFDGSDFSASEDPPSTCAGISIPVYDAVSTPQQSSSINPQLYVPDCSSNYKKTLNGHDELMQSLVDSNLIADSSCNAVCVEQDDQGTRSRKSSQQGQFSFSEKPRENIKSKNSMQSYLKHFQRGNSVDTRSKKYDAGEYSFCGCVESLLFDRVFFGNRLESGSLHLCGASFAVSFSSPFGSVL